MNANVAIRVENQAEPLVASAGKSLLRFLTCGSVDDGKSTLIGRLLADSGALRADEKAALDRAAAGGEIDYSSLVDGLAAEREQGITIDVAYRFFESASRRYIVADAPGHEQYTRNMATAASNADLAILLVDARLGVLPQTRRHAAIASLFGIGQLVLAVNKMDAVGYDQARFDAIVAEFDAFARHAGIAGFAALPLSGLKGDNVVTRSAAIGWYHGPTLIEALEAAPGTHRPTGGAARLDVQLVVRGDGPSDRRYLGRLASGQLRVGDDVTILPHRSTSRVTAISIGETAVDQGQAGQSLAIALADQRDCARGDVIVGAGSTVTLADRIDATMVWLADAPLAPGRSYLFKLGTATVTARIAGEGRRIELDSGTEQAAEGLALNGIGRFPIRLDRPLALDRFVDDPVAGRFVLIDRLTQETVAAGTIAAFHLGDEAAHRGDRIMLVEGGDDDLRAVVAEQLRTRHAAGGERVFVLDEAAMRTGLSAGLSDDDEHRRLTIATARLLAGAGLQVIVTAAIGAVEADDVRRVRADQPLAAGEDDMMGGL